MQETVTDHEPRWTALKACALGWLMPATAARRSRHVRLHRAFSLHIAAALLTVVVVFILVASETRGKTGIGHELGNLLDELVREARRDPEEFFAVLGAGVAGIELGFVILAALLMAWGAGDEPVRSSFANALCRTWLHTSHAVVAVLLVGLAAVPLVRARDEWYHQNEQIWQPPSLPSKPQPPLQAQPGSQASKDYQAALERYGQECAQTLEHWAKMQQERWRQRPWYVKYCDEIFGYLCFVVATWILWALLRAIGVHRPAAPIERPPTCEMCGYNLTATPMESRCPECGEAVAASLGPDVRPGPLWQRRNETGRRRAWWRCCVDAAARPGWFGRQIQAVSPATDHRWFLGMHLVPIFVIGAVGILLCYIVDTGRNPFTREPEIAWLLGPLVGYLTSAFVLIVALLAAGVVGVWYGIAEKRNLMGAAMQAASYLAGYLMLWALFAAILGIATFALEDWFRGLQRTVQIDHEVLAFGFWLLPNVGCLLVYVLLVYRVTKSTRYANR